MRTWRWGIYIDDERQDNWGPGIAFMWNVIDILGMRNNIHRLFFDAGDNCAYISARACYYQAILGYLLSHQVCESQESHILDTIQSL